MKKIQSIQQNPNPDNNHVEIRDIENWPDKTPEEGLRAMFEINKRVNDLKYGPVQPFYKVFRIVKLNQKNSPYIKK